MSLRWVPCFQALPPSRGGRAGSQLEPRLPASDGCTLPAPSLAWQEIPAASLCPATGPDTLPGGPSPRVSASPLLSGDTPPVQRFLRADTPRALFVVCGGRVLTGLPILGHSPVQAGEVCFMWQVITGRIPAAEKGWPPSSLLI